MANELELRIVVKDDGSVVVKRFGQDAKKGFGEAEAAAAKLQDATNTLARVGGTALVAFAAGMTALGVSAIRTSSSFESAFTGVQKTVDATAAEFAVLEAELIGLTRTIPLTAEEMFGIGEAAGQLGIATQDIVEFTEVMAQLGVTTNLSAEEAATSLARFRNITGATETSFGQLGSAIVALGNNLATTEAEIVEFGLRLAGSGTVIGLTEAQILAMGGALSSLGIQAEAGGSAFQKLFAKLATAAEQGGDALQGFADVATGGDIQEFARVFEEDAAGAIEMLLTGFSEINAAGGPVFTTMEDLGLTGLRLQRAVLAASVGIDTFSDSLDLAEESIMSTDALTKEAELRFATFESQVGLLKNAFREFLDAVGDSIKPVLADVISLITPLVQGMAELARGFGELPGPVKAASLAILAVGTAMAGVGGTALIFLPQILRIRDAFRTLAGANVLGGLSKGLATTGLSFKNLGTTMSVLTAKILPSFLTQTVQSRNALGQFGPGVKVVSTSMFSLSGIMGTLTGTVLPALATGLKVVVGFFTGPVGIAVAIGSLLLLIPQVRSALGTFGGVLLDAGKAVFALGKDAVGFLVDALGGLLSFIGEVVGGVISFGVEIVKAADSFLGITAGVKAFASAIGSIVGPIASFVGGIFESRKETFMLEQGMTSAEASVAAAIPVFGTFIATLAQYNRVVVEANAALDEANARIALASEEMGGLAEAFKTAGTDGVGAFLDELDPAVIGTKEFGGQLADLVQAGDLTAEEFSQVADFVKLYREEANIAAEASEDLAGGVEVAATAAERAAEAFEQLGVTSEIDSALEDLGALFELADQNLAAPEELAKKFLAVRDSLSEIAKEDAGVAAALRNAAEAIGEAAIKALELEAVATRLGLVSFDDFAQSIDDINTALEEGLGSEAEFLEFFKKAREEAEKFDFPTDELDEAEAAFQRLVQGAEGFTGVVPAATDAMKLFNGEAGKLPDAIPTDPFKRFADVISDLGVKTIPATITRLKDIPAAIRANVIPVSELDRVVSELDEEYKELRKTAPGVAAALDEITDAAEDQGAELSKNKGAVTKFADNFKKGVKGLTDPENIAGFISAGAGSFIKGDFTQGISSVVSQVGSTIGAAFGPIGSIIGGLAGQLVPVIKNLFSKPEFKKVAKDVGRDLGVDISEELAKAIGERSKELGNRFAAITEALPDIIREQGVESDKQLSTFVARARDNLSLLDQGVFTSAEAFGNLGESLSLLIPEMGNVGASAATTAQVFEVFDAALGQVRSGLADTGDAAKLLETTFPQLVAEMENFGAAGIQGIRGIIEQTRELGIEVESITAFVTQKAGEIAGGVDTIISSLTKRISQLPEDLNFGAVFREAQKEFENFGKDAGGAIVDGVVEGTTDPKLKAAVLGIGTQARFAAGAIATVFSELLAQGVPVTQIIEQVQGSIGELATVFTDLGIEAPESFKKISSFAAKLGREDIAPVIEGIQGMGQALDGLRSLGILTQQDFSDFSTSLVAGFDQLTLSGLSSREAFAALGPQLQDLVNLQEEYGFEVDAGTQALVEQAAQQGVVKVASLDTTDSIQAGFQGLFDRFDAFLGKQGVATEGMFNFGQQASDAMGIVNGATQTAADTMATSFTGASTASTTAVTGFATSATASYSSIAQDADTTAQAQTESFSQSFETIEQDAQQLQINSSAQFETLKADAVESAATVEATFATGFQAIEGGVSDLGAVASNAFGGIEDAAGDAVEGALGKFREMQKELVGASIIPDTVDAANSEISTIGDAAGMAADAVTANLGSGFEAGGAELQKKIDDLKAKLASGVLEGDDRANADRRLDELISAQGGPDFGGGPDGLRVDGDADRARRRRRRDIANDTRRGGGPGFGGGPDGGSGNVFNITVNVSAEVLTDRKALEQAGQQIADIVASKQTDQSRFRGIRRRAQ